ncbi:MAG: hypothetical protein JHC98_03925 [Thermoleophilaceae bacterium]|nr:hypothetical protein [Thermoleophilaceae bacterium]
MSKPTCATSEELRMLLFELAYDTSDGWRTDRRAAELVTYAMKRYAGLAHKYGLESSDAAVAAFEVMRMRSTRVAEDPWAVVTHAVELSLIYESRAGGLLCSTGQARKTAGLDYHDAERFADRDSEIADYHPAFHFHDDVEEIDEPKQANPDGEPTNAYFALDAAVKFFVELGWPEQTARLGLEYIAARLMRCRERSTAYVSLRRDGNGPGLLDIDHDAWLTVLRAVLGNQQRDCEETAAGLGVLGRLVTGEHLNDLFEDHDLADAIQAAAPAIKATDDSHV